MPINSELPVLMYHRIINSKEEEGIHRTYVYKDSLIKQFNLLKEKNMKTITFKDIDAGALKENEKFVILTFDDGYLDNYTILFPLLKEYNFKAVIYPVSHLYYNSWDSERQIPLEKKLSLMTWEQMREMEKSGLVEFGGHTKNHYNLLKIDKKIAFDEIKECKEQLEKELKKPIISFSYPYGAFDEEHKVMVQNVGYKYGIATEKGPANLQGDFYSIRRIEINHTIDMKKYEKMLDGNENARKIRIEKIKKIIKTVARWNK